MTSATPPPFLTSGPLLVGVADDERSDEAARTAQTLGGRLGREVRFVHAVPNVVLQDHASARALEILDESRAAVLHHLRAVLGDPDDLADRLEVSNGPADELLARRARELGASLIVLGPHDEPLPTDWARSVDELLDGGVTCPLWCQPGPMHPPRRVVAPTDLSAASADAVRWAHGLSRALDAELVVLHVFEPPWIAGGPPPQPVRPTYVVDQERANARRRFGTFVDELDLPCDTRMADGVPAPTILSLQREDDVLVLAPRNTPGPAFLGSVSRHVAAQAQHPVVLVPRPAD